MYKMMSIVYEKYQYLPGSPLGQGERDLRRGIQGAISWEQLELLEQKLQEL